MAIDAQILHQLATELEASHKAARLAHALRPGGYLVVGGTERVVDPRSIKLEPSHPFIYCKR